MNNLCADIASLSKALETRLGPGDVADAVGKVMVEPVEPRDEMLRSAEPDTIDLTGGKKKGKTKSKHQKVDREKTENKPRGNKKRKERDAERRTNDFKGEDDNPPAPQSAVQEAARAFRAACKAASMESTGRSGSAADGLPAGLWHEITQPEVSEMMARIPEETAAKIAGSASHKGNFYAVLDRENMCRSGVYPNWLNAEHVKKSASGYGKYGTKQDCIEGALEELETMIEHYNHNCKAKMGRKMYYRHYT